MCKILLIEDDAPKLRQITEFVTASFPNCEISTAQSLNAAVRFIEDSTFDLILLDMSLPTFDGGKTVIASGRQQTLGGRDMLRYLWESEISTPVKVVTGFREYPESTNLTLLEQLHEELAMDFAEIYHGYIYFTHSNEEWKIELSKLLEGLMC